MAERIGSVWAIDIGNTSLKALRLSNESGTLEVIGFDNIPHGKILSDTSIKDQEREELVALTLRQFVEKNDVSRDDIIISVPSANSFARFVNLPPVESKRIPEIVRFEASQQIPFDITEVAWDWQLMTEGVEEAKVGIFAIKNDVVTAELEHFARENLRVSHVQIAPMALCNYIVFDRPDLTDSDTQATVVLNIGAENTDLVVCTKSNVWNRSIQMGGNAFTKAIADTFNLSFEKAEKLKRTAPMSKYARQILQAMKPVFADLASELQRSLGFYSSSNPNTKLSKVVALGGGTKMRGLLQYLQQSLQMPIERPDSFKRLSLSPAVSAAEFHEEVGDFGIVYGLAVQALGLGRIESNLLPKSVARSMAWAGKSKYFVAAACCILVVSVLALARTLIDRASYANKSAEREKIKAVLETARKVESDIEAEKAKEAASEAAIKKGLDLFKYREVIPLINQTLIRALPNAENNPQQAEVYKAFAEGDIEKVKEIERSDRKQLFVTSLSVYYSGDIEYAEFSESGFGRSFEFEEEGERASSRRGPSEDPYAAMRARGGVGPGPGYVDTRRTMTVTSEEAPRGFIVTMAGYSPYKQIGELLDPVGVQEDPSRWGFVNRLMNLDSMFDGNSPFELYNKTDKQHFELKTGAVSLESDMPIGIGELKTFGDKEQNEQNILIDPMTKEVISRTPAVDSTGKTLTDRRGNTIYQENDHWFLVNLKLKWKGVSKEKSAGAGSPEPTGQVKSQPAAKPRVEKSKGQANGPDLGFD